MGRPKNTPQNFWKKVDKSGGEDVCWIWTGCLNQRGYGVTSINWKQMTTHRLAFQFTNGEIPKGLCVCHKCDNPPCCNPKHLFLGTNADNTFDKVSKLRQSRGEKHSVAILPNRPRGEANHNAKINSQDVLEMRRIYSSTKTTIDKIAEQFGIAYGTASKAIRGETWKHLEAIPEIVKNRQAKLSENQVNEIRNMRKNTNLTVKQIAVHFGISVWTCNDIVYFRTRKPSAS